MERNTKIYVVFSSSGLQAENSIYPIYHPEKEIIENKKILELLERESKGIEFIGEIEPVTKEKADYTVANIVNQKENIDGVLYFGSPNQSFYFGPTSDKLIKTGLPIVAVYPLWGRWMPTFNSYKGEKILTSILPVIYDKNRDVFSKRLEDIVEKIKLVKTISKMKRLRVLVITDIPVLGGYEPEPYQIKGNREKYEKVYLSNLKEIFGTELIVIPQSELFEKMNEASEKEAKKVTEKWIDESAGVKGTNEIEIRKSAKLYLAMKELMEKYDCKAITTEGYGVFANYEKGPIPSQGLPSSQFCTDGIVATSETLIDSLITQQLGFYVTGSTGFNGDYIIDTFNDVAIIGHCECPFNPYGDERKVPYVIRNLPLWEEGKGGACVQVNLPINETVTVAKISMHQKKISIFTGETVSGEELFEGWNDVLCRTKLAIKTDAKRLFEKLDWTTFGPHRVAFFGDYREKFKDLAKLIGFEVIEKDK